VLNPLSYSNKCDELYSILFQDSVRLRDIRPSLAHDTIRRCIVRARRGRSRHSAVAILCAPNSPTIATGFSRPIILQEEAGIS